MASDVVSLAAFKIFLKCSIANHKNEIARCVAYVPGLISHESWNRF